MKKIVLLCAAGMSTSMLVQRMRENAAQIGYECQVDAYPIADAKRVAADADIVLLGPQVRFKQKQVESEVPCPVEPIDMVAYGMMDGAEVIKRVKELLGE